MDKNIDLNICSLISGLLWFVGIAVFLLIAANIIDGDWTGMGLGIMAAGSTLYIRRLHMDSRARESVLFELGQLSTAPAARRDADLHRIR